MRARWGLLALLAYVLVMNAWASDDAFITFRTARNLWHGHGLTWNPGWRVQAYTHPLWMFVSAAGYGISGECYYSVLAIAIAVGMGCGVALLQVAPAGWAALLVFCASNAAMQHAVSGLENPLLFLLSIGFVWALRKRGAFEAALLVSAIGLTRTDALVLAFPGLLTRVWQERSWRSLLGLLPLVAWHAFSLVYYGMPYPNTAVAKLNVGASAGKLLWHGLAYLGDSLRYDPLTLLTIVAALVLLRRDRLSRAHAIGIALFLLYLLRIGGDFMSGRFLGAPFVLALAALLDSELQLPTRAIAIGSAAFALVWPFGPWWFVIERGAGPTIEDVSHGMGIVDERAYYYRTTGLLNVLLDREQIVREDLPTPPHGWAIDGRALARSTRPVGLHESVGFFGYFAEDKLVVDGYGLADPLLARIPVCINRFRIGHCLRAPPLGYLDSLRAGRNLIRTRNEARIYDQMHLLAVEPLFTRERWRAIACVNLGWCS